ncbi:hypothetical protein C8P68_10119 [Mucilaginibacter yixingensis]|uniref:Uncharacterized protein n=1 Tax=Mucilaginibacter yixingensis TaxID=1295612 RepID=A0A2T5JEC3_9SPHI|nr:hypothetical protein [Mucilaginibacter yixingensis]PTR00792.1 hypothetical protein C8P68_10119 [Mucilaginibacter yixingensis]
MGETFTFLNVVNHATVKEIDVIEEALDTDDMIFYHVISEELDALQKNAPQHVIENILNFSKGLSLR